MNGTKWLLTGLLAGMVGSVSAQETLDSRVQRLERLMESQALVEMATRLDAMQEELRRMRGAMEEQNHALEGLKRRQRDLYLDIDRRLSRVEREGPALSTAGAAEGGAGSEAPADGDNGASAGEERNAYQQAFDLLRELRYDQAITAFRAFLSQYPEGRYAHIAQYWVGEANYAQRNFQAAIEDYRTLIEQHPKSPKVAESMLKIGYSFYELGEKGAAREVLERLVRSYPSTTEAGQARNLLQKLKSEI